MLGAVQYNIYSHNKDNGETDFMTKTPVAITFIKDWSLILNIVIKCHPLMQMEMKAHYLL